MKSGFDPRSLDRTVRPQDDFFQFAVGGWLKKNPIPRTESRWGSFYVLRDQSLRMLRAILEDLRGRRFPHGSDRQKLRDFYESALDQSRRNREKTAPLEPYLSRISRISSQEDFFQVLAQLHALGLSPLWSPFVSQDDKRSEENILHLWQATLVMPDREYYLKSDARSQRIRHMYLRYIAAMLRRTGRAQRKARRDAATILALETKLARASRSRADLRDVEKQYHRFTLATLAEQTPNIRWRSYFDSFGVRRLTLLIVGQPEFFRALDRMVCETPLDIWKMYLEWRLIDGAAPFLSEAFVRMHFDFHGRVLSGAKELKPLWKRAVAVIDDAMGEALGKLYVERHFGIPAKQHIDGLVRRIVRAYARRILRSDWMEQKTKALALKKLRAIRYKIAYPRRWRDYRQLKITPDAYLENYFRAQRFETARQLAKIGKPVDRAEWLMTPPTVNAYYSANLNEICFPAGILQPPFFDPRAFDAVNYGAIGSVIGHELTHGFDDQGRKFDAKGNMREWWTKQDRRRFTERASALIRQFHRYTVSGGVRLNGRLTLGENIADLGGLVIAYDAFNDAIRGKKIPMRIGGFTPHQLFFLAYAQVERGHVRPEEERRLATIDPHAPPRYRTNGPLSNMDAFHRAFSVGPKDKMYRRPEDRVTIW